MVVFIFQALQCPANVRLTQENHTHQALFYKTELGHSVFYKFKARLYYLF